MTQSLSKLEVVDLHDELAEDPIRLVKTYCIVDDIGNCKVGISISPLARLTDLQVANPQTLRLHGTLEGNHEDRLHRAYQHLRKRGEWFQADINLLSEFDTSDIPESAEIPFDASDLLRKDNYGGTYLFCPRCPGSSAFADVIDVFFDTEITRYRNEVSRRKVLRLFLRGGVCRHEFEITISDSQLEVRQIAFRIKENIIEKVKK